MTDTERPLTEVAREMLESRDVERDAATRRENALAQAHARGLPSFMSAELFVQGYEARCAEENATFSYNHECALARIAELEAQLAGRPQVTEIVVDDEVCDIVCDIAESLMYAAPEARRSHVLRIVAALTSATTVPLASAEPIEFEGHGDNFYRWVRDGE